MMNKGGSGSIFELTAIDWIPLSELVAQNFLLSSEQFFQKGQFQSFQRPCLRFEHQRKPRKNMYYVRSF